MASDPEVRRRLDEFLRHHPIDVDQILYVLVIVGLVALLATCALLAGCGGQSASEQVKETVTSAAEDARAGRWGDYCAGTTDPDACSEEIMTALALRIDLASLIPTSDVLDGMKVTVKGERATVDSTAAEDATYVLRDGRWLYLWETE